MSDHPAPASGLEAGVSNEAGQIAPWRELAPQPRRNYARWRALSLSLVYLVFAAHIIHWKITGKTLAPLELNEVMYTLELGIVTAGFLFMCFLVLGTTIFGRFFCSWACHIMVLQDLSAWLLRKLRIRQKPIRSRLLLLVPPLTAFYMFIWPQILRAWHDKAFPTFHLASDSQGWASFVTNNFWRNLPSAPVIILTFVVCGFVIVYLLGSRTFCTYVCPYGAIFALADRFAPGRIRVTDACRQCGTCTAACTSGVRVHEEVKSHGMIVNSGCLKDLDCIAACPQSALYYSFGKPSLFKSVKSGGRFGSLPYDFSLREELLIALVFVVVLLTFRGLYSRVPFLLSLALGGIIGYLSVVTVGLFARPNVTLATLKLKQLGRLTRRGGAFVGFVTLLTVFVGHSAFVRYHEFNGLTQARALEAESDRSDGRSDNLAMSAWGHLSRADRWGLLNNERVERRLLAVSLRLQRFEDVRTYATRLLERFPFDFTVRLQLGKSLAGHNRAAEAQREFHTIIAQWEGPADSVASEPDSLEERSRIDALSSAHHALGGLYASQNRFGLAVDELRQALTFDATRATLHAELGSALAELGQLDEAVGSLRESVRLDPHLNHAHYNLGTALAHLGRFEEAILSYEKALETGPADAELLNNFGFALLRTGQLERARKRLEQAVTVDPNNADAHFNLGNLFTSQKQVERASEYYRTAARLDPRYAKLLSGEPSD